MHNLNIDTLGLEEKFMMIEQLWDSLKDSKSDNLSPKWHIDVLEKREDSTNFISLEDAKKNLENMLK